MLSSAARFASLPRHSLTTAPTYQLGDPQLSQLCYSRYSSNDCIMVVVVLTCFSVKRGCFFSAPSEEILLSYRASIAATLKIFLICRPFHIPDSGLSSYRRIQSLMIWLRLNLDPPCLPWYFLGTSWQLCSHSFLVVSRLSLGSLSAMCIRDFRASSIRPSRFDVKTMIPLNLSSCRRKTSALC